MELYEGYALQQVDEKGRVAIPADLRAAVERNSDVRSIVVSLHPFDPCLSAHDLSWSHSKRELIDSQASPFSGDGTDARTKRRAFGVVERASFDASGRFILPPFFRMKARIGKWALFNGAAETFDIWSPEVLMATDDAEGASLRELCEFLCQQKGVAL